MPSDSSDRPMTKKWRGLTLRLTGSSSNLDWATAMRSEPLRTRITRGEIAVIRWTLRLTMALLGAAVLYSWVVPKPLIVAHKKVPTYSMMAE